MRLDRAHLHCELVVDHNVLVVPLDEGAFVGRADRVQGALSATAEYEVEPVIVSVQYVDVCVVAHSYGKDVGHAGGRRLNEAVGHGRIDIDQECLLCPGAVHRRIVLYADCVLPDDVFSRRKRETASLTCQLVFTIGLRDISWLPVCCHCDPRGLAVGRRVAVNTPSSQHPDVPALVSSRNGLSYGDCGSAGWDQHLNVIHRLVKERKRGLAADVLS